MRKTFLLSLSLLGAFSMFAQTTTNTDRVGNMKTEKFKRLNDKGAAMVMAITPTSTPLTAADNALFMQVAMGGMKQLAISQAVVGKATSPQVRMLAQSEVEEQTTVSAKLREIATAKGITMPATIPDAATAIVSRINNMSGDQVDAIYIAEGGIRGHQELQTTMTTVRSTATDPALKALAKATLPVIKAHLKVSTQVQGNMGSGTTGTGTTTGQ